VDVDIWVALTEENLNRLRQALHDLDARPHFLPPLEMDFLRRGHGVHFKHGTGPDEIRVDILGQPPRVDDYASARAEAVEGEIEGVRCRIIDPGRLVHLKKTLRPRDYLDIRALVDHVFQAADQDPDWRGKFAPWLAQELRTPLYLLKMAAQWPTGRQSLAESNRAVCQVALEHVQDYGTDREEAAVAAIEQALAEEFEAFKQADLAYWEPLLQEIRELRRRMKQEGDEV